MNEQKLKTINQILNNNQIALKYKSKSNKIVVKLLTIKIIKTDSKRANYILNQAQDAHVLHSRNYCLLISKN